MSNSAKTIWSRLDSIAFIVTVGSAVITGIFAIWAYIDVSGSEFAESAANIFVTVTAVGGMAMGLLYLRRRLTGSN